MRIAYLDCFSGISGDMFLGALVDAGVPFELLQKTVAALNVGATLERALVTRNGISATKIDVVVNGVKDKPREEFWLSEQHTHEPSHSHGRHLSSVLKLIATAPIAENAKHKAAAIFTALGEAEARVHNTSVEKVHFHEVGATDAIVDIVCAAAGSEELGVDQIIASPLNVGGGTVTCAHGVIPIPAPATLELLKGIPVYSGDIQKELVTPTGAALVRVLATSYGPYPAVSAEAIGYGAGSRDFNGYSNVLRLVIGQACDQAQQQVFKSSQPFEEIVVIEANLDDLNPQVIGYVSEKLLSAGALDVFSTAAQMKKGRPGTLLTVLASPGDETSLRDILFVETSTLGIRSRREQRYVLARRYETVRTPWGEVRIKIGSLKGTDSNAAPEYEDCRRIATQQKVSLKQVMQEALRLYLDKKNG
jgi:uncharacterized protein (TIGR00299 family) protein